ncbi:unnamed protein product [Rhizophagus irregularis]|nr:unnamed protein product [Rhizophagus irregularis]
MSENNSYQGDVYVDPITGFVTTIDPPARPKSPNISNNNISASPTSTPNKPSPKLGPRSNSSDLIESLKSKSSDLLANIRIQTGSPRSSLQGESPRSSLHKTSVESDSEVPNNSSKNNGIKVFEESTNEESQENDVIDNQKSSIIESPETSKNFQLIIEQRERQLTSAIEQNALLNDTVEKFKLQLKELEENKNDELKIARNHVEGLENQLKGANKELNMFRQQEASKESSSIQNLLEMQRKLLLEKDEQISGLMSEGEKLRTRKTSTSFRSRQMRKLKRTLEINATLSSQAQTAALEKEIQINERLHHELEQLRTDSENTENSLRTEIRELRATLARIEEQAGLREDNLRHEISTLQKRLQIAEAAAQDENIRRKGIIGKKLKNSLSKQLTEMEMERDHFADKFENLNNQFKEMSLTAEQQELQLIDKHNQNIKLNEEIKSLRARIPNLEAKFEDLVSELESSKETHKIALQEAEEQHLEGQVGALQAQLQMTTKNRDELADELVKLTVQMEDYSTKAEKLSVLEQQLYELNERYHITLELLGEKTKQVDELQADIKDRKM